jgi:hypothetical protein
LQAQSKIAGPHDRRGLPWRAPVAHLPRLSRRVRE